MISSKLVAASSVPIVLGILTRGESYGYAILQQVRALSGGKLEWTEGMLYPVLHRMERDGLLRAKWRPSESGRRRKCYALSVAGKRELERERTEWKLVVDTLNQLWGASHA